MTNEELLEMIGSRVYRCSRADIDTGCCDNCPLCDAPDRNINLCQILLDKFKNI